MRVCPGLDAGSTARTRGTRRFRPVLQEIYRRPELDYSLFFFRLWHWEEKLEVDKYGDLIGAARHLNVYELPAKLAGG